MRFAVRRFRQPNPSTPPHHTTQHIGPLPQAKSFNVDLYVQCFCIYNGWLACCCVVLNKWNWGWHVAELLRCAVAWRRQKSQQQQPPRQPRRSTVVWCVAARRQRFLNSLSRKIVLRGISSHRASGWQIYDTFTAVRRRDGTREAAAWWWFLIACNCVRRVHDWCGIVDSCARPRVLELADGWKSVQ